MTTPGNKGVILKKAREQKGISLESVHEATKIPLDALRAIEEGYTLRTLSSFYYKGFVKIYAQHLNVDVHEVIEDYKKEILPPPFKKDSPPVSEFQENIKSFLTPERTRSIAKVLGFILALFIVVKVIGFVGHKIFSGPKTTTGKPLMTTQIPKPKKLERGQKNPPTAPSLNQREDTPTLKPSPSHVESKPSESDGRKEIHVEPPPAKSEAHGSPLKEQGQRQEEVVLVVRAKKNSWLQVRVDGVIVFQSILKKGVAETWSGSKEIELLGKNLNLLEFELNGKMIGSLGREDRKARKVIVTKSGLSVEK